MMGNPRPHLFFFPFPTQGHVNPFFSLALSLLSSYPSVVASFLCTRSGYDTLRKAHGAGLMEELSPRIRFLLIPEEDRPFPETRAGDGKGTVFTHLFTQFEWLQWQAAAIEKLIAQDLDPPVSCMLVDYFLSWTTQIAARVGVQWCIFCTSSALWIRNRVLAAAAPADDANDGNKPLAPLIRRWMDYEREWRRNMAMADCVLFNTFPDIDAATLDSIQLEMTPMKAIGPVLSPPNLSIEEDGTESLAWLDTQPHSSVVYISFGSMAELPLQQLQELALGIKASGCRFLWVIRNLTQSNNLGILPEGFLNNSRGCVLPWVAQLQVLKHPAIAFFLTHCGWNSILESVTAGIPLLCMPMFGDQFLNSDQVIREWGIGLPLARNNAEEETSDSIVDKTEIERVLRIAMEEETATHFKLKSAKLAEIVRASLQKGGSSYKNMSDFFQIISTK